MKRQIKKLETLKKMRISKNISCKDISGVLNISKTYYWQIENGSRRLSYELAKKIAKIFNLKPDDIFYSDI